jgi:hypothetical protein
LLSSDFSVEQRRWLTELGHPLWRHADAAADRAAAAAAERKRRTLWAAGADGHVRVLLPAPADELAAPQHALLSALLRAASLHVSEPAADLPAPGTTDPLCLELDSLTGISVEQRRALWPALRRFRTSASTEPTA